MTTTEQIAACERTFRRYGLPLLVHGHSARRDIFGRAAPFLVVVLLLEAMATVQLSWPWWLNLLAVLGVMLALGASYAGLNVLRGRRWSTLPQDVGGPELVFFVLAPAVLPLLFGGQWLTGAVNALVNIMILLLVWAVVGYGLAATLWWGMSRVGTELGASLVRLIRFLPLLLIFSIALFYNAEVWQVFDHTPGVSDVILGIFFAALILLILSMRLRAETQELLTRAEAQQDPGTQLPPLSRAQELNVTAMVGANQLLQVIVVSVGVGVFFFALGVLTITPGVLQEWGIDGGTWQVDLTFWGETLQISQTLLRVSVALATFTGLYYAISVLTDAVYRSDFVDEMVTKMADVTAHRVIYHQLLDRQTETAPHP
ncbi:hypothetical protein [Ruania albidiflava]|uniref:hypothetical protein n=1 Tax=Ruania albidiflava TaxID=366586 RepID=UPI0003B360A6|nr:hypothetical protein [Ruania albidiflava]